MRDIPHQLPNESKNKRLLPVDNVCTLDTNQVEPILLREVNDIVRVFDALEA